MAYLTDKSARRALVMRAGRGVGLGDVSGSELRALLEQVNRFTGPGGPAAHRFAPAPFDVAAGNLSAAAAMAAILIYQTRLLAAQTSIADTGTSTLIGQVNAAIRGGSGAVISWVTTNAGRVTQAIGGYADSLGLPGKSVAANAVPELFAEDKMAAFKRSPILIAIAVLPVFAIYQYLKARK